MQSRRREDRFGKGFEAVMYKIGVIGNRDAALCFMAVGFSVFEADSPEEAARHLNRMVRSGEYGVIFITENYASRMEETIGAYREQTIPAIVSIPDESGSSGYGMSSLRRAVVRAVGVDILDK